MKKIENIGRLMFFALVVFVLITACGRKGPDAPPNTMPAAFSFTAQTNIAPNTVVTSNSITVSGINTTAQISIVGGEYSIDGGAYTSAAGTVTDGQTVTVRLRSAPNFGTTTNAVLTIGGISSIFSVTTIITTTTTTISAPAVQYGANGSVTVTVSSAAGTPGGSVLLSVDGSQTPMWQQLNGGSTAFTIPTPSAGSHTLNATYVPDGYFLGSSASGTLGVGVGATTMTLSAPAVTYNANGLVTITVNSTGAVPTGDVSLSVDGNTAVTQTLTGGATTFTLTSPSAGPHTLSATYATQGNFLGSSASGTLNVNQAATTTSIAAPGITYGTDGSVTVMVSSTSGTPTGKVSLSVDNGTPMTQPLSSGSTTFTIPGPSAGVHTLNAAYAAQGNFGASSASGSLGVGVGATTMTLSAPDVTYNANGLVTITVSSAGVIPIPTGDVSLSVDGNTAVTQTLSNGATTFTLTSPGAGPHTLSAAYAAQGNFGASSASGTLNVNQATTTTSITALGITYGADGIVTVTVSSTAGTPTGDVSLSVDNGAPMTQALSNGSATFTIPSPSLGSHVLNAAYAAQGNYGASSAYGTLGVGSGATTMVLSAPTITYGADGIVTVTVSSTVGTPTGDVSLSVDGGAAVVQTLIGGSTTFTISSPIAGNHTLNAAYAAQGNFGASSASGTLIVNKATASVTLSSLSQTYDGTPKSATAATSPSGLSVDITNDGSPTAPTNAGSYAVVGTVNDANYQGSASGTLTIAKASATVTLGNLSQTYDGTPKSATAATSPGGLSVDITYDGSPTAPMNAGSYAVVGTVNDANYQGSASGTLTISQGTSTTSVTSAPNPSNFSKKVTFTATVTPPTATGTVTFVEHFQDSTTTVLGTATLTFSAGMATAKYSTETLPSGSHTITAEYSGNGNLFGSTSDPYTHIVN